MKILSKGLIPVIYITPEKAWKEVTIVFGINLERRKAEARIWRSDHFNVTELIPVFTSQPRSAVGNNKQRDDHSRITVRSWYVYCCAQKC
jgi:hypothetical protein